MVVCTEDWVQTFPVAGARNVVPYGTMVGVDMVLIVLSVQELVYGVSVFRRFVPRKDDLPTLYSKLFPPDTPCMPYICLHWAF